MTTPSPDEAPTPIALAEVAPAADPDLGDLVVDLPSDRYLFDGQRYEWAVTEDGGLAVGHDDPSAGWTEVARFGPGQWCSVFREHAARGAT
jgi:hypothetical protein